MTRLFIYGTLKRGQVNHHLIESESFLVEARTTPDYRLLNLGWYPGMAVAKQDGQSIAGELWKVSPTCLAKLDEYEGGEYQRIPVTLIDCTLPTESYLLRDPDWTKPDVGIEWTA